MQFLVQNVQTPVFTPVVYKPYALSKQQILSISQEICHIYAAMQFPENVVSPVVP